MNYIENSIGQVDPCRRAGAAAAAAAAGAANALTATASRSRGTSAATRSDPELGGAKEGPATAGSAILPRLKQPPRGRGNFTGRGGGGGDDRSFQYGGGGGRRPYNRGWAPRGKRRN
jgi:hypothetical protein